MINIELSVGDIIPISVNHHPLNDWQYKDKKLAENIMLSKRCMVASNKLKQWNKGWYINVKSVDADKNDTIYLNLANIDIDTLMDCGNEFKNVQVIKVEDDEKVSAYINLDGISKAIKSNI